MVIDIKSILQVGLAIQATSLVGQNVVASRRLLDKKRKNKKSLKTITKTAVTNIIGIPLLQIQAQLIGRV